MGDYEPAWIKVLIPEHVSAEVALAAMLDQICTTHRVDTNERARVVRWLADKYGYETKEVLP